MGIWVAGTSNQLFIRLLIMKPNFKKNKAVTSKTPFCVLFCTPNYIFLNIGFSQGSFICKCCFFNVIAFNEKTILQFFQKDFRFSENLF